MPPVFCISSGEIVLILLAFFIGACIIIYRSKKVKVSAGR